MFARSHTERIVIRTRQREEFVPITDRVAAIVERSGVHDGLCLVSTMHITSAVYVNDFEYGLIEDIREWLGRLAPPGEYRHHLTGEDNAESHLRSLVLHMQVVLPITDGALELGTWQQVFYAEFDGMREKKVLVKAFGLGEPDTEEDA